MILPKRRETMAAIAPIPLAISVAARMVVEEIVEAEIAEEAEIDARRENSGPTLDAPAMDSASSRT